MPPAEPPSDDAFTALVEVEPKENAVFLAPRAPEWEGRTYGGQLLAQGLAAAHQTLDDQRPAHSLHAYFMRAGDVTSPTTYRVEQVRDGRSFSLRQVSADQGGRELFRMMVSFQVPEDGLDHQPGERFPIEELPGPDEVPLTYTRFTYQVSGDEPGSWPGEARLLEIRYLDPPDEPEGVPVTTPQLMWMRVAASLPEAPLLHELGVAYLSDATLIDHVMLPHGLRWQDHRVQGTSLDHALWFHRPARADQWLLYHQQVETTVGGRGLATGRFYRNDGVLVATCAQEGLMRWRVASEASR